MDLLNLFVYRHRLVVFFNISSYARLDFLFLSFGNNFRISRKYKCSDKIILFTYCRFTDILIFIKLPFYLLRTDIFSIRKNNQILFPACKIHITFFIHSAQVASCIPAFPKHFLCLFFFSIISHHQRLAFQIQFSILDLNLQFLRRFSYCIRMFQSHLPKKSYGPGF